MAFTVLAKDAMDESATELAVDDCAELRLARLELSEETELETAAMDWLVVEPATSRDDNDDAAESARVVREATDEVVEEVVAVNDVRTGADSDWAVRLTNSLAPVNFWSAALRATAFSESNAV